MISILDCIGFQAMDQVTARDERAKKREESKQRASELTIPFPGDPRDFLVRSFPETPKAQEALVAINAERDAKEWQAVTKYWTEVKTMFDVVSIERVHNPTLLRSHVDVAKDRSLDRWMWHGTRPKNAERIVREGYDLAQCRRGGKAVYLASFESPYISLVYAFEDNDKDSVMLLNRVALGNDPPLVFGNYKSEIVAVAQTERVYPAYRIVVSRKPTPFSE